MRHGLIAAASVALALLGGEDALASPAQQSRPATNSVHVSQVGDGNRSIVRQTQNSDGATASIVQNGDDNEGLIEQRAGAQTAGVVQAGQGNLASIIQDGGSGNVAQVVQTGGLNQAAISQMAANIQNTAVAIQTGERNVAAVDQAGSGNTTLLAQTGDDNLMKVEQTGDGNTLVWTQTGSNLSAPNVLMQGGQSLTINQLGIR